MTLDDRAVLEKAIDDALCTKHPAALLLIEGLLGECCELKKENERLRNDTRRANSSGARDSRYVHTAATQITAACALGGDEMNRIDLNEYVQVCKAFVMYHDNVEPLDCLRVLFPESYKHYKEGHREYIEKQLGHWHAGLNVFFGYLDDGRRHEYVRLAMERYREMIHSAQGAR
jgi:hypothetical protein